MSCELSHVTLHVGLEHADDVIMMGREERRLKEEKWMNTRLSALTKHPRGSTAAALGQAQTDHVSFIGSGMTCV